MHVSNKRRSTPVVVNNHLYWNDQFLNSQHEYKVPVETAAWFQWLDSEGNTTFYFDNVVMEFTARREKRRQQFVWYAYKKANGRPYKAYIGPSHLVNQGRLKRAAESLYNKI